MKQKIIKGVAIATLSLMFFFCLVPQAKASGIPTSPEEGESIYNNYYYEFYTLLVGEEPPQYTEMLDICASANPNLGPAEIVTTVSFQMYQFLVNNSSTLAEYYYQGGFDDGKRSGYAQGYQKGTEDTEAQMTIEKLESFSEGYNLGLATGKTQGFEEGKNEGIQLGYAQYEDEKGSIYELKNLIFSIINAPFNIIKGSLNFEVFGVNVSGLVLFLISCGLVVFVLKKVL